MWMPLSMAPRREGVRIIVQSSRFPRIHPNGLIVRFKNGWVHDERNYAVGGVGVVFDKFKYIEKQ